MVNFVSIYTQTRLTGKYMLAKLVKDLKTDGGVIGGIIVQKVILGKLSINMGGTILNMKLQHQILQKKKPTILKSY